MLVRASNIDVNTNTINIINTNVTNILSTPFFLHFILYTYFLKRKGINNAGKIKSKERIEKCKEYKEEYAKISNIENGILYLNGDRIDIQEYLNGNIKKIETLEKNENLDYFDITQWDEE